MTRTIAKMALALLAIAFLIAERELFLVAFIGLMLCVLFSFPVNFFSRHMRRGLAVLLTLAIFLPASAGLSYAFLQPMTEQAKQFSERVPEAFKRTKSWFEKKSGDQEMSQKLDEKKDNFLESALERLGGALMKLSTLLSFLVLVFITALYFVADPDLYRLLCRSFVPKEREKDFDTLWQDMAKGLRRWIGGAFVSMTIMGFFTALALSLAGIQDWFLLALLTFFGTFVPYAGAIASAIPGLLIALSQSNEKFLIACGIYLCVHILEGHILEPLIMKRAVTTPPAVLILWQFLLGSFAGVLGIVVATPLYVCVKILIDYLYVEKHLEKKPYPPMKLSRHS